MWPGRCWTGAWSIFLASLGSQTAMVQVQTRWLKHRYACVAGLQRGFWKWNRAEDNYGRELGSMAGQGNREDDKFETNMKGWRLHTRYRDHRQGDKFEKGTNSRRNASGCLVPWAHGWVEKEKKRIWCPICRVGGEERPRDTAIAEWKRSRARRMSRVWGGDGSVAAAVIKTLVVRQGVGSVVGERRGYGKWWSSSSTISMPCLSICVTMSSSIAITVCTGPSRRVPSPSSPSTMKPSTSGRGCLLLLASSLWTLGFTTPLPF